MAYAKLIEAFGNSNIDATISLLADDLLTSGQLYRAVMDMSAVVNHLYSVSFHPGMDSTPAEILDLVKIEILDLVKIKLQKLLIEALCLHIESLNHEIIIEGLKNPYLDLSMKNSEGKTAYQVAKALMPSEVGTAIQKIIEKKTGFFTLFKAKTGTLFSKSTPFYGRIPPPGQAAEMATMAEITGAKTTASAAASAGAGSA